MQNQLFPAMFSKIAYRDLFVLKIYGQLNKCCHLIIWNPATYNGTANSSLVENNCIGCILFKAPSVSQKGIVVEKDGAFVVLGFSSGNNTNGKVRFP